MKKNEIFTQRTADEFRTYLIRQEKSRNTVEKYCRDVRSLAAFASGAVLSKELALDWKNSLSERGLSASSVNSMIASANSFFGFIGMPELKLHATRVQKQIFRPENEELTRDEYFALVRRAEEERDERASLILQTICSTGIRVSELGFITVEAALNGKASVSCKGKTRDVIIVRGLQKKLLEYASCRGIAGGSVIRTKNGQPLSRVSVWREMKRLCEGTGIDPKKVYPHNLRHLFARSFYDLDRDIAKLADVLGHASIDTTRIYVISTGEEHRRKMEQLCLVI